jgi:hypothetical protein
MGGSSSSKLNIMIRNTLQELDQFNVGDKVDIYNSITGEVSYSATIESIAPKAYVKDGEAVRAATILDDMGNRRDNYLGTAKKH